MTSVDQTLVAEADRYVGDPATRTDPYGFFHRMLEAGPALQTTSGVWLVSRHAEVQSVLRNEDQWSRREAAMAHAVMAEGPEREVHLSRLLTNDGANHQRLRRLVAPAFTKTALKRWKDRTDSIAADLLAGIEPGVTIDVVSEYAFPLPEQVICEIIGIPLADRESFNGLTLKMGEPVPGDKSSDYEDTATTATRELMFYVRALIAERRGHESDDLLSLLMLAEEEGSKLSENELVGIVMEMIVAGHETTGNLVGNGVLAFIQNPDQYRLLRDDPTLLGQAVEEILRYEGPAHHGTGRVAIQDVQMGDVVVARGDTVVPVLGAANRDPRAFEAPDTFDITRKVNPHVGFGFGTHYCIGFALARLEAQVAFGGLVRRFALMELDADHVTWRKHQLMRGLKALPVKFS